LGTVDVSGGDQSDTNSDFLCIGAEESGAGTFGWCSERINTDQM